MRKIFHFLTLLLLLPSVSALHFTEVMYDPPGSDNNKEFVEVHGNENFSQWIIGDLSSNDTLTLLQSNTSSNYSLIVEEGFDYSSLHCNIYSAGATIGNNLNNGGDRVVLYDKNGTKRDELNFSDSFGKNNGYSLELINISWQESDILGGTPCFPPEKRNQTSINETNQTGNQTKNETNQTTTPLYDLSVKITIDSILYQHVPYLNLFRVENELYTSGLSGRINATILYNVTKDGSLLLIDSFEVSVNSYKTAGTGRIQLNETGNYTLCGRIVRSNVSDENNMNDKICHNFTILNPLTQQCNVSLTLEIENQALYYREGGKIRFRNELNRHNNTDFPFEIIYTVETLDGKIVRNTSTSNENLKSYTPKTKEKVELFLLKNHLSFLACNNSNQHLSNEYLIVLLGEDITEYKNESFVEILEITKPLDVTKANHIPIKIYKGETGKYSVKLWAEDEKGKKVAETISFKAKKKLTTYELSLPLIFAKSGTHKIILCSPSFLHLLPFPLLLSR